MTRDTTTGRFLAGRGPGTPLRCPSCDARLQYGEPSTTALWEGMDLTVEQMNKLTLAAAELDAMSGDERPTAVEFCDWVRLDAIEGRRALVPYTDGREGNPDPIPWGGREAGRLVG